MDASLAEVHTLTVALTLATLLFAVRFGQSGGRRDFLLLILFSSQGVAHQRAVIFLAPAVAVLVLRQWREMWRGLVPALVLSLLEAKNDFSAASRASRTVVLVSDGKDTCGGRLSDVVKAYRNSSIDVVIHVVGFDVEKDREAKRQLQLIAESGRGHYFDAGDADQLASALHTALHGMPYEVLDPASGKITARGGDRSHDGNRAALPCQSVHSPGPLVELGDASG